MIEKHYNNFLRTSLIGSGAGSDLSQKVRLAMPHPETLDGVVLEFDGQVTQTLL